MLQVGRIINTVTKFTKLIPNLVIFGEMGLEITEFSMEYTQSMLNCSEESAMKWYCYLFGI
jgi:hypothetical protein